MQLIEIKQLLLSDLKRGVVTFVEINSFQEREIKISKDISQFLQIKHLKVLM